MIIEIDEKDFKVIQDKIGDIRTTAIVSKMIDQENSVHRLDLITSWANEITALLNSGVINDDKKLPKFKDIIGLYADPPDSKTKFIERYSTWICEKCGYKLESNILPVGWEKKEFEPTCPGCYRKIVEMVPLVREGG